MFRSELEHNRVEVCEDGVCCRIGEMRLEVGNRTCTRDIVLNEATHRRDHSKPTVGDLFDFENFDLLRVLGIAHGVEKALRVTYVSVGIDGCIRKPLELKQLTKTVTDAVEYQAKRVEAEEIRTAKKRVEAAEQAKTVSVGKKTNAMKASESQRHRILLPMQY